MNSLARNRLAGLTGRTGCAAALTVLLSLSVGAPAVGQVRQVTNPLRSSQLSPRPDTSGGPRTTASEVVPVSHQQAMPRSVGFVPKHERVSGVRLTQAMQESNPLPLPATPVPRESFESTGPLLAPGETLVEGPVYETHPAESGEFFEPVPMALGHHAGGAYGDGGGSGVGGACCDGGDCWQCCPPCSVLSLHNLSVTGGVHGFTSAVNRGESGSFGFHYGLNWGTPLSLAGLGFQVGANFVHSNFAGGEFTDDNRNQIFLTAGLFRRVDYGLQGGIVVDYLRDDWNLEVDLAQLRGELSWVFPNCHELGFWFTTSTQDFETQAFILDDLDVIQRLNEVYEPTDLYAFFYRRQFNQFGGEGRVFAGFTGKSDGLLGADLNLPLSCKFDIRTEFTYLIPEERTDSLDHRDEAWNVGLSLVWHLGPQATGGWSYYRPLFDVANNGSFISKRK